MSRFADVEELRGFLRNLDKDYAHYADNLWQKSLRTAYQLANASKQFLLSCDLLEVHIDDIKARAVSIGSGSQLNEATIKRIATAVVLAQQQETEQVSVALSEIGSAATANATAGTSAKADSAGDDDDNAELYTHQVVAHALKQHLSQSDVYQSFGLREAPKTIPVQEAQSWLENMWVIAAASPSDE